MRTPPTDDELTRFGFGFTDEGPHAVEEPRLPIVDLCRVEPGGAPAGNAVFAYQRWGLGFSWKPDAPLRSGRFRFSGFGRVLSGPRSGLILPVGADLLIEALGAAHSMGRARAPGHESERFPASRFEQPIALRGTLHAGGVEQPCEGRGEHDHSVRGVRATGTSNRPFWC